MSQKQTLMYAIGRLQTEATMDIEADKGIGSLSYVAKGKVAAYQTVLDILSDMARLEEGSKLKPRELTFKTLMFYAHVMRKKHLSSKIICYNLQWFMFGAKNYSYTTPSHKQARIMAKEEE